MTKQRSSWSSPAMLGFVRSQRIEAVILGSPGS